MAKTQGIPEKTDAQWAAESDAQTLADANVILADDKRVKAAKKAVKAMIKDKMERADYVAEQLESLLKIAGRSETVEGMKIVNKND